MNEQTMQLESHFFLLIYSFHHTVGGNDRSQRLAQLNDRWQPWWRRLFGDRGDSAFPLQRALDDTYFFLPSIREMLFPEIAHLPVAMPLSKSSQRSNSPN